MKKIILLIVFFFSFWFSQAFATDYTINLQNLDWETLQNNHTFAQWDSVKFINAWTGLYYSMYNWDQINPWYHINNNDILYIYWYDCYAGDFCISLSSTWTISWSTWTINQTAFLSNLNYTVNIPTSTWTLYTGSFSTWWTSIYANILPTSSWAFFFSGSLWENYINSWWLNNVFTDLELSTYDPINQNLIEIKFILILALFFGLFFGFYYLIIDLIWKK